MGITLSLVPSDIYFQNDYWHVPIRPSHWQERLFAVIEELAVIEAHLQDDHHLKAVMSLGEPVNKALTVGVTR